MARDVTPGRTQDDPAGLATRLGLLSARLLSILLVSVREESESFESVTRWHLSGSNRV
jgi:hypothetical protein